MVDWKYNFIQVLLPVPNWVSFIGTIFVIATIFIIFNLISYQIITGLLRHKNKKILIDYIIIQSFESSDKLLSLQFLDEKENIVANVNNFTKYEDHGGLIINKSPLNLDINELKACTLETNKGGLEFDPDFQIFKYPPQLLIQSSS